MLPKMPSEYKGKPKYSSVFDKPDGTNNGGRLWTNSEVEWVMNAIEDGYSLPEIAESVDRGLHSVAIKVKRIKKKNGHYNEKHLNEKYKSNLEFYNFLKPKSILDAFCGIGRYWKNKEPLTIDNDINKNIESDYTLDANEFMKIMIEEGKVFDMVDIDPFGSAYDFFDNAYKLSDKGLVVTFGEMGHKRWKRLDYVGKKYNIHSLEDFTHENIISYWLEKYNDLNVYKVDVFQNIVRVYFYKNI